MTQEPVAAACYRHPDRFTYIACQRCGNPICGDCMISASVGFQCPDCVRQGAKQTRQNFAPFGGVRSENPALTSIVLIAMNALVWLAITLTGGGTSLLVSQLSLSSVGFCWLQLPWSPAEYGPELCASIGVGLGHYWVIYGGYWQLFSSAFTHIDIIHLAMNMLALWFLGPSLESVLGRARFLAVYLISALAGSVAVFWIAEPLSSVVGASGAIFGLIGALLVVAYKVGGDVRTILIWLGINIVFTFFGPGNISWQGHLGGLIGGLITAAIIVFAPREERRRGQLILLACLTVALYASVLVPTLFFYA